MVIEPVWPVAVGAAVGVGVAAATVGGEVGVGVADGDGLALALHPASRTARAKLDRTWPIVVFPIVVLPSRGQDCPSRTQPGPRSRRAAASRLNQRCNAKSAFRWRSAGPAAKCLARVSEPPVLHARCPSHVNRRRRSPRSGRGVASCPGADLAASGRSAGKERNAPRHLRAHRRSREGIRVSPPHPGRLCPRPGPGVARNRC